jgi:hypothetical protein
LLFFVNFVYAALLWRSLAVAQPCCGAALLWRSLAVISRKTVTCELRSRLAASKRRISESLSLKDPSLRNSKRISRACFQTQFTTDFRSILRDFCEKFSLIFNIFWKIFYKKELKFTKICGEMSLKTGSKLRMTAKLRHITQNDKS